ncbi:type VI secretion system-associated FHA domain protein TagH [Caballeronia sp. RCC_10]|uniref:type VI secretion system-associated FHA domain protein TagH n=1 Tax=Caballeronia sp. RCC_10 TaxID=3239227 RepID=UPI0035245300
MTLAVRTYQGDAPDTPLVCRFDTAGGTIGRGPGNTMVLPDAAKTISRVQARIDWCEDGWQLADLGSNASRLNGRALAGGRVARLADGDCIEAGGYRLDVSTLQDRAAFDAPLGVHDRGRAFANDALADGSVACADGISGGFRATANAFAQDLLASGVLSTTRARLDDPLARAAVLFAAPLPSAHFDPLGAPLTDARTPPPRADGRAAFAGSASDHVSPEQFAYAPQGAAAAVFEGGIPHDYDPLDDVAGGVRVAAHAVSAVYGSKSADAANVFGSAHSAHDRHPLNATNASDAVRDPNAAHPVSAAHSAHDRHSLNATNASDAFRALDEAHEANATEPARERNPVNASDAIRALNTAHAANPPDSAHEHKPVNATSAPNTSSTPPNPDPTLMALLDGLGVDVSVMRERGSVEFAHVAGAMLRTAVRGTVNVLLSRSVLKRGMSVDTTLLVQRGNNPLKFFPDGDAALAQMLRGANAGYLGEQAALEGAFDDIRSHELAVLAAMRAAMQHLLRRFDPATIATEDAPRRWLDWLPGRRKARQWDRLVALHGELARAGADDLHALCGSAFNDAYERYADGCSARTPHGSSHA